MGADGAFITGSDFLMDGGVTAAYWYGELAPKQSRFYEECDYHWRQRQYCPAAKEKGLLGSRN